MTGYSLPIKGKNFIYFYRDKPLKDKARLERIRKPAIPPS
jgi:hypothetical protein